MIIHVGGIPGSGKTYICSQLKDLKNVLCIDVDDITDTTYRSIRHNKHFKRQIHANGFPHTWDNEATILKNKIITKNKDKILVLVGIDNAIDADVDYFIEIDDIGTTYRRYMIRELDKIVSHQKKIRQLINDVNDPYFIKFDMDSEANIVGFPTYYEYIESYNAGLAKAKQLDAKILTQKDIINEIRSVANIHLKK